MPYELQRTIHKLQGRICPEAGTGLGGIEVMGNRVIGIIQVNDIPLRIQQRGNTGHESVDSAISLPAIGKEQLSRTIQLQCAVFQIHHGFSIGIINGQGILATQRESSCGGHAAAMQREPNSKGKTGKYSLAKKDGEMKFHRSYD